MSDLEKFLHNDNIKLPSLIRIGIAHYQFETIHPFLDGNGRIGRLLITLYLVSKGILDKPLLYLSTYFESNKKLYYDNLMSVRMEDNMLEWLKYFLTGVRDTAAGAVLTLSRIIDFKRELEITTLANFGRRANSALLLQNYLYENPVISVDRAKDVCSLSYKAANNLVDLMQQHGLLKEITGQSRNRLFLFQPYLKAFG